jgi:putative membrane protein
VTADEAPPEHIHLLSVLTSFGKSLRQMIGGLVAGGYFASQGRWIWAALLIGGIAGVTAVGLFLQWWRFSYRVGDDALRIDSGILSRNHRTIPFDRVADVSLTQGPLQRLFGVAKVTLETGGGSGTSGEEGVLGAVALSRAEALREHVRARRMRVRGAASPEVAAAQDMTEPADDARALFAMDGRRVLTSGVFNFSLALFAGLFGVSQTFGDAMGVDPFEREFWEPLLVDSGLGDWLLAHRFGLALGGLAVLVLAGILTGIVRTTLRDWHFKLERTGAGLRRRRGLLTKTDVTLPIRRVQAGVIATGPIRERFGWFALSVKSLAGDASAGRSGSGQEGDHLLAPLASLEELEPVAGELGWSLPRADAGWRPVSRAHLWSFLSVLGPFLLLVAAAAAAALLLAPDLSAAEIAKSGVTTAERDQGGLVLIGALTVGVLGLLTFLRWLEWKRTFYALEAERLLIRTGWWKRRTFLLPLRNVQTVELQESSLSRLFGVAQVVVGVAGGSVMGHRVPSLPRKEAQHLQRTLLSRQP